MLSAAVRGGSAWAPCAPASAGGMGGEARGRKWGIAILLFEVDALVAEGEDVVLVRQLRLDGRERLNLRRVQLNAPWQLRRGEQKQRRQWAGAAHAVRAGVATPLCDGRAERRNLFGSTHYVRARR